jgi:hypothetical protein
MATLSTELPGLHNDCEPGDDECEDYEDLEYDSCPELMTETFSDLSDTESDDTSSDSESEDDIIIATAGEAENSDDSDYDEAEPDSVDSKPDSDFKAKTPGKTAVGKPPRFNVPSLKPFEVMFCDEKAYPTVQRGGWNSSFILLDMASDAWFKQDESSKTQHGEAFTRIMVQNGVHLLPYHCTVYRDGCGSMKHVETAAIRLGINCIAIPPYEQSLNEAERIADRAFAAARVHLTETAALPSHMAMAVDHVCYMKLRMATTQHRGWLTPYQIIKGYAPSISHCMPFFTKAFVTVPKEKRTKLKKQGLSHLRSEEGNLVGYQDLWGTTPKVLLDANRLVSSRNVTYDLANYGSTAPDPNKVTTERDITITHTVEHSARPDTSPEESTGTDGSVRHSNPLSIQEGASQDVAISEGDDLSSPLSLSPSQWPSPEVVISSPSQSAADSPSPWPSPEVIISESCMPEVTGRVRHPVEPYKPHDDTMEARPMFLMTLDKLIQIEHEVNVFDAKLEAAMKRFNADAGKPDCAGYMIAAAEFAAHAQKDMNWKKALASPERTDVLKALDKELTSLQATILTRILPGDSDFENAVKTATPGRLLLDIKRSGVYKARGVKQGFRENKEQSDGDGFNYYSSVVKLSAVRIALTRRRTRSRVTGIKDVSTAFLQAHGFPKGTVKFIVFKNPVTGDWEYYRQSGPIYGEASAPVRWEQTIAPWLEEQGFTRGENERCVFYHADRDLLVLLYVDDVMADGEPADVDWVFELLAERFQCKDADYITAGTPQDYLGMVIGIDEDNLFLSMATYIDNACEILGISGGRVPISPITDPIDTTTRSLDKHEIKQFLTAVGMLGWLATTVRLDVAYAYSRIAQHSATPTVSAMESVLKVFRYLQGSRNWCISAPVYAGDKHSVIDTEDPEPIWRFMCDSDHAGNSEVQNRRRSQNGLMITQNTAPVVWQSKASSVAFACSEIKEAHADVSSAAVEIYSAGNATFDILATKYVVEEMGMEFPTPFTLEMDNDAARIFVNATAQKTKLKHIDCRQEWVRTLRNKDVCNPVHIPTKDNLSDIFTKILSGPEFERLRAMCMKEHDIVN